MHYDNEREQEAQAKKPREEKFCNTGRHHVPANRILSRKGRKDVCLGCVEKMKERKKLST